MVDNFELLNLELEHIREDRIIRVQIRGRSLKPNKGENPSSYFLSLEKANYINKSMMELYHMKDY